MIRIYKLTNEFINPPKSYIGQTSKNLEDRLKEHMRMGQKGVNRELALGLMEYGKINFTIELLEEVEADKSHIKEDEYIRLYKTHYKNGYGYNMKYEDIVFEPKIKKWDPQDIQEKTKNVKIGQAWNKGIKTKKYISEKIKNTIQSKKKDGWINSSWGHKHTNTTKKLISENKKIYYTNNRPHNAIEWFIEYENGTIEKTNRLLEKLGGKKEYNRITKWCRNNPKKIHPKMKIRVYYE